MENKPEEREIGLKEKQMTVQEFLNYLTIYEEKFHSYLFYLGKELRKIIKEKDKNLNIKVKLLDIDKSDSYNVHIKLELQGIDLSDYNNKEITFRIGVGLGFVSCHIYFNYDPEVKKTKIILTS